MERLEKRLLDVYKTANPSTYRIESDAAEYEYRKRFITQLIENRLKLPRQIFSGAKLLEFGAGTGEHSHFYLKWGANGTFVDFNDDALKRMERLFDHYSIEPDSYNINHTSIYNFEIQGRQWDIVLAMGLLHHLKDKEAALEIAASCVAPGGFLVLGVSTMAGLFQISLQRWAVKMLAGNDDEEAYGIAERLFEEHISRSEKFGRRSRKSIIYDTYINPKIDGFGLRDIIEQVQKSGMTIYSSWPHHLPTARGDSAYRQELDFLQYSDLLTFPEIMWMSHRDDDVVDSTHLSKQLTGIARGIEDLLRNANKLVEAEKSVARETLSTLEQISPLLTNVCNPYSPALERTHTLTHEAKNFMQAVLDNNISVAEDICRSTSVLFRGTSGIGINYFVAHRPHCD